MSGFPIVNRFGHTICKECKKTYVKGEFYPYCGWECKHRAEDEFGANGKLIVNVCKGCGREFKRENRKRYCDACSSLESSNKKSLEQKAQTQNKLWVEGKTSGQRLSKLKKRHIPYEILDRMEEKKRVMDESGWDHYLRGRKWDKI